MKTKFVVAFSMLLLSTAANAQLTGIQVNGSITFNGGTTNYFDPANGFVPSYAPNYSGLPVTTGSGYDFVVQDSTFFTVVGDFTPSELIIGQYFPFSSTYYSEEITFTTLSPGAFDGLSLESTDLIGLSYNLTGDTLTVDWAGGNVTQGDYATTFGFVTAGVPEPSTWAMMLLGFAGIGATMRARKRARSQTSNSAVT